MITKPPTNCVFCELQFVTVPAPEDIRYRANCRRCGSYAVSYAEHDAIERQLRQEDRPVFSQWVYEQNRLGEVPIISSLDIPVIASRQNFSFIERARRFLWYMYEHTVSPGDKINILCLPLQAALQTFDPKYIGTIAHHFDEEKLVKVGLPGPVRPGEDQVLLATLTPRGIMQAEEWGRSYTASAQGFVAMWFDKQMEPAWEEGFYRAIDEAGYIPRRIDNKEHINKICDEIIAEIRRSRFVVADFTGHRGGVYYEAGYAGGRDIPVIWTCRKNELSKLHFDIRQYNCIDWEAPEELARRLKARIEAVIGEGPRKHSVTGLGVPD
jgi:hypothetical protein